MRGEQFNYAFEKCDKNEKIALLELAHSVTTEAATVIANDIDKYTKAEILDVLKAKQAGITAELADVLKCFSGHTEVPSEFSEFLDFEIEYKFLVGVMDNVKSVIGG